MNRMAQECHEIAVKHGFYGSDGKTRNILEALMLVNTELCEAAEHYREKENWLPDFSEEMADAIIRIFDLCSFLKMDIDKEVCSKIEKNKNRPFMHNKRC